ncbi:choice-of-anchor Q domain-containing protein [Chloroflexota bacterium]
MLRSRYLLLVFCALLLFVILGSPATPTVQAQSLPTCEDDTAWPNAINADCVLDAEVVVNSGTRNFNGNGHTMYAPGYTTGPYGTGRHFTVASGATLNIENVTLTGGSAGYGGAISNIGDDVGGTTTVTVTNSTFSGNRAGYGGAIDNVDGIGGTATVTVTNSTFSGNSAGVAGGAISNADDIGGTATVTVTNSTFSGNSAGVAGGAIDNAGGIGGTATVTVTNSTFSGNNSADYGGAISNIGNIGVTATVTNSIFNGGDCSSAIGDGGGNIKLAIATACRGDVFPDLLLGPLQDNGGPTWTHALLPGSPALDMTTCADPVLTDQRGIARPLAADECDSGAYEARKQLTVVLAGQGYGTVTGGPGGIDCGTACFAAYDTATEVTLTATAAPGSIFAGWSGYGVSCGLAATCTVLVEAEQTVTATFSFAEAGAIPFGDPVACDAIQFVGGWGIFAEGTPEQTSYTVPEPPAGYSYIASPIYDGYCDVFVINQDHSPLPVQVCWEGASNAIVGLYHDLPDLSRAWAILPTSQQGESVCASLPAFGGVALLSGGSSVGTMAESPETAVNVTGMPVNCQVTTTHRVNFRATPNGEEISRVPYETTLTATTESNGWYMVEWLGQTGWISGEYVAAICQ